MVDLFSLTFVNFSLAWMLHFHVRLTNKGKFLVWSEYYNQRGIYQPFRVRTSYRTTAKRTEVNQRHIQNPVKHLRWSVL